MNVSFFSGQTKVINGASISGNGVAGYAGSIDFESVNLQRDTLSNAYFGYGSWNTFKSSLDLLSFIGFSRNGQGWIGSSPEELSLDFRANGCAETETYRLFASINKDDFSAEEANVSFFKED